MKRKFTGICILLTAAFSSSAQDYQIDSLKQELPSAKTDTAELILLGSLAYYYSELNPDSSMVYASRMQLLARKMKLQLEESFALSEAGYALLNLGNYPRSLQILLDAVAINDDPASEKNILPAHYSPIDVYADRTVPAPLQRLTKQARTLQYLGILYGNSGNLEKAKEIYLRAIDKATQSGNFKILSITYTTLGRTYLSLNNKDSALWCVEKAREYALKAGFHKYLGSIYLNQGRVYQALGRNDEAEKIFFRALQASKQQKYYRGIAATNLALADIHKQMNEPDSVLHYIHDGLVIARYLNAPDLFLRSYKALAGYYKTSGNSDSIVKYQSLIIKINDSLFNSKQAQDFQNIDFNEQQRKQEIAAANAAYREKFRTYLLLAGFGIVFLIALILWRNSRQRRLANIRLSKQKAELESTLDTLKTTQKQLVQSEKMASLGEMTAGIAHEIQNPLNFVNNFSEVNTELIEEMKEELKTGNTDDAINLADDIKANNEKITFHGKRADSIVKGMLQHSRSGSNQKEATNINNLLDECLRLSFHGMRAKDKSFNAKFETDFDSNIATISIVSQEIGRVFLNLFTNAFYSVMQKKKTMGENFSPVVSASTQKEGNKVKIIVRDNGNGIPKKVIDKIFQPFFTTKPTGEGTGLGLSMSYDIVTKGHDGELKVESKEGEYAEFTIILPA